ncbi:PIR protein [Plasmodium vivax]|uniref:VIR protein n=1 Tax=Plasmodium vivax TaxID=5855 RepID=A0A564ZPM4_PLAVI|nr:PIR protein [Plasmodium vivax]
MGCDDKIESDSYDFFEDIENYINKVNSAQNNGATIDNPSDCDNFSTSSQSKFTNSTIAKNTCVELVKLYKSINSLKEMLTGNPNYKNDCRFFNYWVNFKITKSRSNEYHCVSDLYNAIESHCYIDFPNRLDVSVIYDIKKDDLYKMNILYNLYENYIKLKNIIDTDSRLEKQSLLPHSTACCTDYIEAKYICNGGNNNSSTFCKKLRTFESKYEQLYQKFNEKTSEFSDDLIKLSECPNTKIITTAVTGSIIGLIPLFGVLYKFTPMGQVLRSKMGILNNDDEITNVSLMEQENEQLRLQKGKYNIKYQSL